MFLLTEIASVFLRNKFESSKRKSQILQCACVLNCKQVRSGEGDCVKSKLSYKHNSNKPPSSHIETKQYIHTRSRPLQQHHTTTIKMVTGLQPLEFKDCQLDSPEFRENLNKHEKELEKTSQQIKRIIKEVKDLLAAAKSKCLNLDVLQVHFYNYVHAAIFVFKKGNRD